jgi:hypothetical protein
MSTCNDKIKTTLAHHLIAIPASLMAAAVPPEPSNSRPRPFIRRANAISPLLSDTLSNATKEKRI